jgi:hypothetical protein
MKNFYQSIKIKNNLTKKWYYLIIFLRKYLNLRLYKDIKLLDLDGEQLIISNLNLSVWNT